MSLDEMLFDLFVTAPADVAGRQDALVRLIEQYALELSAADAFMEGTRVLLRGGLDPEAAQIAATAVQGMGLRVDLEPHEEPSAPARKPAPPRAAAPSLPAKPKARPKAPAAPAPLPRLVDDDVGPPAVTTSAPVDKLGGLFNVSLRDEDEDLSGEDLPRGTRRPPPVVAEAAPSAPARPNAPPGASGVIPVDPFRPAGADSGAIEIQVDRPVRDPMRTTPPPIEKETFAVPRCPTHDIAKHNGRCIRCEAEDSDVAGKLFSGRLRRSPTTRAVIGLGAGLLIGWLITAPMARRAESQVTYLRDEAAREHARPLEEAQAHAAALDTQADDLAQSAFIRTFGIWAVITAAVTGVWFRLT